MVLSLVLNTIAGLIAARMSGFGRGPAANIGLTILGRGEFSLILATLAVEAGLDARIGPFVGFYVLILALVAPILASRSQSAEPVAPGAVLRATGAPPRPRDGRAPCRGHLAAAHNERMDTEAALRFARENHRGVLATRRQNGRPQMSPIACAVDDDGKVVISTRETAVKTKNVRRDPNVSLCVFADSFYGAWVQIDGTAEIVSLPDAMDGLVDYYRSISGEHPDWDDYRSAMQREKRCLIRITITAAGPDVSG